MTNIRTFRDVVHKSFFNEIENRVSQYVEQNFRNMEFKSYRVQSVDEARVFIYR